MLFWCRFERWTGEAAGRDLLEKCVCRLRCGGETIEIGPSNMVALKKE
jgi:hypothetical protein